jgi:MFS transporter, DHA1 family, inner membrane transport protein
MPSRPARFNVGVRTRHALACFALAVCISWNAGNVGPVAAELAREFDVGLSTIGLASGTFFFAGVVAASLAGAELARRIPVRTGLIASCSLAFAGNVICALSPSFAVLSIGRVLAGVAVGLVLLFAGAYARAAGGLRLLGLYGAGVTLGVAAALGVGGLLEELDATWWVPFAAAAGIALVPLPLIPREVPGAPAHDEPRQGVLREAVGIPAFWRLQLLATSALGIPMVIGAWLVVYLVGEDDLAAGVAGAVSFAMFGLSAASRYAGGLLSARDAPAGAVAAAGCIAGAAGIAALALIDGLGGALLAALLIGLGLSLPSALVYDEGERVLPDRPLGGLGLILVGASSFPIVAIPLVGVALGEGDGEAALLAMAGFVLLAGVANLKPAQPAN